MDDQRVTRQGAEHRDIVGCLDLETAPRQGEAGYQAQPGPQSQPGAVHQIERGSTIVISEEPIRSFFRRIGLERRLQAGSASSGVVVAAIACDLSILASASNSAMISPRVGPSKGLPCSALACSTNWPPLGFVAGVATKTLQPNSYGVLDLTLPDPFEFGACSA